MPLDNIPYEFVQGGGYVGPDFTGVFFFENVFWRVVIPIVVVGQGYPVNVVASLIAMPEPVSRRLVKGNKSSEYKLHWADCFDYDYGRNHVRMQPGSAESTDLIESADRDLLSTIADLSQHEPNSNAMHNARMATERALKALLCSRYGYTLDRLKKGFGHDLQALLAEVISKEPTTELSEVRLEIDQFRPYDERYKGLTYSRQELWTAYRVAQFTTAALMRTLTPYNQRASMGVKGNLT